MVVSERDRAGLHRSAAEPVCVRSVARRSRSGSARAWQTPVFISYPSAEKLDPVPRRDRRQDVRARRHVRRRGEGPARALLDVRVWEAMRERGLGPDGIVLSVGTFALLAVGVSWLSFRFRSVRKVLEAAPLIVIQDGRPIEKNLRTERLTLEEVAAEARLQQIASLEDVAWGIVESGGRISFIPSDRS